MVRMIRREAVFQPHRSKETRRVGRRKAAPFWRSGIDRMMFGSYLSRGIDGTHVMYRTERKIQDRHKSERFWSERSDFCVKYR